MNPHDVDLDDTYNPGAYSFKGDGGDPRSFFIVFVKSISHVCITFIYFLKCKYADHDWLVDKYNASIHNGSILYSSADRSGGQNLMILIPISLQTTSLQTPLAY